MIEEAGTAVDYVKFIRPTARTRRCADDEQGARDQHGLGTPGETRQTVI